MINYILGDATNPVNTGTPKIIVHCCNDIGAFGAGFVVALSRKWKSTETEYRNWYKKKDPPFKLGQVQFVKVEEDVYVANLIGQQGIYPVNGNPPVRYPAISEGFIKVKSKALELNASVHVPRLGCGLAGPADGWVKIAKMLQTQLTDNNIPVYVYTLPREQDKFKNDFART